MKRKITKALEYWKTNESHMPYMLIGARQVGKTYIIEEFCKNNYKDFIYINLEWEKEITSIFEETIVPNKIINRIEIIKDMNINEEESIIFFDEIQVSEKAITSLKYFNENEKKYNIICAGSLLGVALNRFKSSYPVGKVRRAYMFPMDFEEFIWAIGQERLASEVRNCFISDKEMFESGHEKLIEIYKEYLYVGGMPASILHHISNERDLTKYKKETKQDILSDYIADMSKYTTTHENIKIKKIYESIPKQLGREKNKFTYKLIDEGAKKARYETAIDWLINSKLVHKCTMSESPRVPLKVYEKDNYFKIYLSDVGLLMELSRMTLYDLFNDEANIFRGMITENFVAQTLTCSGIDLNYWKSGHTGEIDFLINIKGNVIPVEVKSATNTKSKSLKIYKEKYNPKYSIKISTKNFGYANNIKSVPLYAVHLIGELL